MNHNISPYVWPGVAYHPLSKTPRRIIDIVCHHYEIHPDALKQRTRAFRIVRTRHICWTLIKRYCGDITLKEMARLFGSYDHATVIHWLKALANDLEHDEALHKQIEHLARKIKNIV